MPFKLPEFHKKTHSVTKKADSPATSAGQAAGLAEQLGAAGNSPNLPVVQQTGEAPGGNTLLRAAVQVMLMDYMKDHVQVRDNFSLNEKRVALVAPLFNKSAADFTKFLNGKRTTELWLKPGTTEQFGEFLSRFVDTVNRASQHGRHDIYRKRDCLNLVNSMINTFNQQQTEGRLVLSNEGSNQSPEVVWQANAPVAAVLVTAGPATATAESGTSSTSPEAGKVPPKKPPRAKVGVSFNNTIASNAPVSSAQAPNGSTPVAPATQPAVISPTPPQFQRAAPPPAMQRPLDRTVLSTIQETSDPEREELANKVLAVLQDYLTTPGLHSVGRHREQLLRDLAFEQRDHSGQPWRIGDFLALGEDNQLRWTTEPSLKQLDSLPGALRKSGHRGKYSPLLDRLSKAIAASRTSVAPPDAGRFVAPAMPLAGTVNAGPYTSALKVFENYLQTPKGRQRLQQDFSKSWIDRDGVERRLGEFIRVEGPRVTWAGSPTADDLKEVFNGCRALGHSDKGRLLPGLQQVLGQAGVAVGVDEKVIGRIAGNVTSRPLLKNAIQDFLRQLLSGAPLSEDSPEIVALVSAYADQEMARLGVDEELSKNYRPDDWKIHYGRRLGFLPHRTSEEVRSRTKKITLERERLAALANRFVRQGTGTDRFLDMLERLFGELHKSNSPVVKNLHPQRLPQQKDVLLQAFQVKWGDRYGQWANAAESEFARRLEASQQAFSASQLGKIKKPAKYQAAQDKVDQAFAGDDNESKQLHTAFGDVVNRLPISEPMKMALRRQLQENRVQLAQRQDDSLDGLAASFSNGLKTISAGSKIEFARQIRARENEATNQLEAMLRNKMSKEPEKSAEHKLAHAKAVATVKAEALHALKTIKQQPFSFKSFVKGLSFKGPLRSIATVLGGGLSLVGLVAMALPSAQVLAIVCLIGGSGLLTYGVGGAVLASLASTGHSVERAFITLGARWEAYRAERRYQKLLRQSERVTKKLQARLAKEAQQLRATKQGNSAA